MKQQVKIQSHRKDEKWEGFNQLFLRVCPKLHKKIWMMPIFKKTIAKYVCSSEQGGCGCLHD